MRYRFVEKIRPEDATAKDSEPRFAPGMMVTLYDDQQRGVQLFLEKVNSSRIILKPVSAPPVAWSKL